MEFLRSLQPKPKADAPGVGGLGRLFSEHLDAVHTGREGEQVQAPWSNSFVSLHYELGAPTAAVSWTGHINSVAVY